MKLTANTVRVRLAAEDWHKIYQDDPTNFPHYALADHLEESGDPRSEVVRDRSQHEGDQIPPELVQRINDPAHNWSDLPFMQNVYTVFPLNRGAHVYKVDRQGRLLNQFLFLSQGKTTVRTAPINLSTWDPKKAKFYTNPQAAMAEATKLRDPDHYGTYELLNGEPIYVHHQSKGILNKQEDGTYTLDS